MTVQDWGAIGELVGALAVVVTLIYLTLQMRQNTRAIRAQSVQDVTMSVRDYLLVMGQSSEFAAVLAKAQDEGLSALESKEEVQLRIPVRAHLQLSERLRSVAARYDW